MFLKRVPHPTFIVKLSATSSVHTTLVRNLFIQASQLHPRKASWIVDQPQDGIKGVNVSPSSSVESDQNKQGEEEEESENSILLKCRQLLMSVPDESIDLKNSDISYHAKFGLIRLDSDNQHHLKYHDELNMIDEQYFGESQISGNYEPVPDDQSKTSTEKEPESGEFIDRYYFGDSLDQTPQKQPNMTNLTLPHSKQDLYKEKLNYIDEVFFKDELPEEKSVDVNAKPDVKFMGDFEKCLIENDDADDTCTAPSLSPHAEKLQSDVIQEYKSKLKPSVVGNPSQKHSGIDDSKIIKYGKDVGVPVLDESEFDENASENIQTEKFFHKNIYEPEPGTAYDYVVKMRKQKKEEALQETSEDGSLFVPRFKRITSSVLDLRRLSKYELRKKLEQWIIYDKYDIVGFYKPYGLQTQGGGQKRWNDPVSLTDLLPDLCQILSAEHLHHIHRLDATTSGLLLFARTLDAAEKLRKMFKEHTLIKTYLAIVKNVPSLSHGLIDVPLKEGLVDGKMRMVPQPEVEGAAQRRKRSYKAVTKFKVVSQHQSAALLSLQPVTGVKHQIRAHLGLVLNCPILADHKYSNSTKIVPQKLSSDLLQALQMKQSRVRDLPTMLHASSVFLPQFAEGKNVKISCPPPPHFTIALKALKLSSMRNATKQKSFDYVDLAQPKI